MHIAIYGDGQLARMLALSGIPLGMQFTFITEADTTANSVCVDGLGKIITLNDLKNATSPYELLGSPDIITIEKEEVDVPFLAPLAEHCPLRPGIKAIETCKRRFNEKTLLDKLDIPTAQYVAAHNHDEVNKAIETLSLPVVIKADTQGYDGKGQWVIRTPEQFSAFTKTADAEFYIVEKLIPFDCEASIISTRSPNGEITHYPISENRHEQGILVESVAPAPNLTQQHQVKMQSYIEKITNELDYVGVIAMECFIVGDDVLINELAPRVHNSGHWTQNGSFTSQFENHIRAISGLPLGSTHTPGYAAMVNLIGTPSIPYAALIPKANLHWYNKAPRAGRKLGHINVKASTLNRLLDCIVQIKSALPTD